MSIVVNIISANLTHDTDWIDKMVIYTLFRTLTVKSISEGRSGRPRSVKMGASNPFGMNQRPSIQLPIQF